LTADVAETKENIYGRRFEIRAPLATPSGRRDRFSEHLAN